MAKKVKKEKPYYGDTPLEDTKKELFCQIYSTNTLPNFWANGQNSYAFAFGHQTRIDEINAQLVGPAEDRKGKSKPRLEAEKKRKEVTCRNGSLTLLTDPIIKLRCGWLMDEMGKYNIMDRELLYTIHQRKNLESKVSAIMHHDKREARIREKVDVQHVFEPIKIITITTPEKK